MMAARTMSLGTHDLDFLKETLHGQQELLQKLYNELDMERESSATAADEALSMILRLQGEKSAMEMEASQYKRIAEEKMCHAQETVEIFQELIYQKEMHIASLEFQVQAYRFKLLSMGADDLGVSEMQYPENMLSRRKGITGETSSESSNKRGSSLPPPSNGSLSRRTSSDGAGTASSSPKTSRESRFAESSIRREQTIPGDFNSYWEEIKKLNKRVKEFSCFDNLNNVPNPEESCTISGSSLSDPPVSTPTNPNPSPDNSPVNSDCSEPEKVVDVQACGDSCSTSVQDIFEVPHSSDSQHDCSSHKKEKPKLSLEKENRIGKFDSGWDEVWKSDVKEKIPLLTPSSSRSSPKPNDVEEKVDWEKRPLLSPGTYTESPKPREGKTPKQMLLKQPTYGVADFELLQFNRRLKQLEDERFVTKSREINPETGEEELRLLREIREQINLMQAEMTNWQTKKPHPPEDRVGCFKEAVMCFLP